MSIFRELVCLKLNVISILQNKIMCENCFNKFLLISIKRKTKTNILCNAVTLIVISSQFYRKEFLAYVCKKL